MGEDVSALRRLEARRATVSDSVYSLDRMGEATIKMRVPVGSPIILRAHDKTLSHSVRYAPCSETSLRHFIQAFFERLVMSQHAMPRESLQDGVRLAFTNLVWRRGTMVPLFAARPGQHLWREVL
jgi:hypothetical protein